jgi:hypothetical protein
MKKNLLVIVLIFYSFSTIGQVNSSTESERLFKRDLEIQREQEAKKLEQTLKSIENKTENKEDIVAKYARGSDSRKNSEPKTDPWTEAIAKMDKKTKLNVTSKIKESDLYIIQSDGTRRAKYPYVPSGATTIEQVEKYFKEHPSEMKNFKKK